MVYIMRCYPVKKHFVSIFKNNEEVLEQLIQKNSPQIMEICEKIDYADFYHRLISFYNDEDYELKDQTIVYTHPITKQVSYCFLSDYYIIVSDLMGFDLFLYRYYRTYFTLNEKSCCGSWLSFENTY